MKKSLLLMLVLMCTSPLWGCAGGNGMEKAETPSPDLSVIQIGSTRAEVEVHLGEPVASTPLEEGGSIVVYAYEIGREPGTAKSVGCGAANFLTFGLWRALSGVPDEGQGADTYRIRIRYDSDGTVAKID